MQYAVDFCLQTDESDIDSDVGGMISAEEEEIDSQLLNEVFSDEDSFQAR